MTDLGPIFERLGLTQYLEKFIDEGFDTWEIVLEITEPDFDALGKLQREIAIARDVGIEASPAKSSSQQDFQVQGGDSEDGQETSKVDGAARGKRKYQRHPKPDEHAPGRPQSAYVIFSNSSSDRNCIHVVVVTDINYVEVREDLKNDKLSFSEIAKRVGEKWQVLSAGEKEPFESQAAAAKGRYLAAVAEYKKTDKYQNYLQYLADFKMKNPPKAEGKRPRLEKETSAASSGSHGSHGSHYEYTDSIPIAPQRRVDPFHGGFQASASGILGAIGPSQGSPTLLGPSVSNSGNSPTASQSSLASSTRNETSISPLFQSTPRQLPLLPEPFNNASTTGATKISTNINDARNPSVARGHGQGQISSLASVPDNSSSLSNFRRSTRPPASFRRNDTTLSSKSTSSRSSEPSSVSTHPSPGPSGEDVPPYRLPPISTIGLQPSTTPNYSDQLSQPALVNAGVPGSEMTSRATPTLSSNQGDSFRKLNVNIVQKPDS
ncbi:MAG: hypothetical protein Q9190_003016 [Brigantiaea leucoxantha]